MYSCPETEGSVSPPPVYTRVCITINHLAHTSQEPRRSHLSSWADGARTRRQTDGRTDGRAYIKVFIPVTCFRSDFLNISNYVFPLGLPSVPLTTIRPDLSPTNGQTRRIHGYHMGFPDTNNNSANQSDASFYIIYRYFLLSGRGITYTYRNNIILRCTRGYGEPTGGGYYNILMNFKFRIQKLERCTYIYIQLNRSLTDNRLGQPRACC